MALQEFLASYAVRVDEDGARRLQRILDQNRTAAQNLSSAFSAARSALAALKKELADTSGFRSSLASLSLGSLALPRSGSSSGASTPSGSSVSSSSVSRAALSVVADMSGADKALDSYKTKVEALRPRLSVNATGITSAVSSAISTVRAMMSSVSVTIPVKVKASVDTSGVASAISAAGNAASGSSSGSGSGSSSSSGSGTSSVTRTSGSRNTISTLSAFSRGGRVEKPTLAMIGEEGEPEYVIPVKNESRALPLLRDALDEISASARESLVGRSDLPGNEPPDSAAAADSASATKALPPSSSRKAFSPSDRNALSSNSRNALPPAGGNSLPSTGRNAVPSSGGNSPSLSGLISSSLSLSGNPIPSAALKAALPALQSGSETGALARSPSRVPTPSSAPKAASPVLTSHQDPGIPALSLARVSTPSSAQKASSTVRGSSLDPGTFALRSSSGTSTFVLSLARVPILSLTRKDSTPLPRSSSETDSASLLSSLSRLTDAARSLITAPAASGASSRTVNAPVNIHVTATTTSPEAVGQQIYNTATRSLQKTLQSVFA